MLLAWRIQQVDMQAWVIPVGEVLACSLYVCLCAIGSCMSVSHWFYDLA